MTVSEPLHQLSLVLSDSEGKYWDDLRNVLASIASELANELTPENTDAAVRFIDECRSSGAAYFAHGYAVVAMALRKREPPTSVLSAFARLLEELDHVSKDNDRILGLFGNGLWPGVLEYRPTDAPPSWSQSMVNRAIASIRSTSDESMKSFAIARFGAAFEDLLSQPWIASTFSLLRLEAVAIRDERERAEALVGLADSIGRPDALPWATEEVITLLGTASQQPDDAGLGSHPRSSIVAAVARAAARMNDARLHSELLAAIERVTTRERAHLTGGLMGAACAAEGGFSQRLREWVFGTTSALRDSGIKAEAVAAIADAVAEALPDDAPQLFDRLLRIALEIRIDEAKVEAMSGSVSSIAVALAKVRTPWSRQQFQNLFSFLPKVKSQEQRGTLVGNLVSAATEGQDPEWSALVYESGLRAFGHLKNEQARVSAIRAMAHAIDDVNSVDAQRLALRLFEEAKKIEDDEERLSAVADLCEEVAPLEGSWIAEYFSQVVRWLAGESDEYKALGLKTIGEDCLHKIKDSDACRTTSSQMIEAAAALNDPTMRAVAIGGVCAGLASSPHRSIADDAFKTAVGMAPAGADPEGRA